MTAQRVAVSMAVSWYLVDAREVSDVEAVGSNHVARTAAKWQNPNRASSAAASVTGRRQGGEAAARPGAETAAPGRGPPGPSEQCLADA